MISIIVPVYNVRKYLDDCISSIVRQVYTDWECILVDDGSTDGSGIICDNWAEKDNRISVVHQNNAGVSNARNAGISVAKGDYIAFIDSDDWVGEDYLQQMHQTLVTQEGDIAVIGMRLQFKNGTYKDYVSDAGKFLLTKEFTQEFVDLNSKFLLYGPVCKLFHRSVIMRNDIRFDERLSYGEDLMFVYSYLDYVNSIVNIASIQYNYRIIGENTLSTKVRSDMFDINYVQWKILKMFYEKKNMWNHISQDLLYRRLWGIIYDGIFLFKKIDNMGYGYIEKILSIDEISDLKGTEHLFTCAPYIKKAILKRSALFFYLLFLIK
ncbi:MAG: glycosyltransferase family 2 protein [Bacteroidales bacterium]|nr:glycosyltransferase family 2 protein [Bacteroidales bacterium]